MVGHVGSSVGSYLADPTSPIPSHCASIVTTSTVRVKSLLQLYWQTLVMEKTSSFYGSNSGVIALCVVTFFFLPNLGHK